MKTVQKPISQSGATDEIAQRAKVSVRHEKTLISNNIRWLSADADNIWIATDQGVSRYMRKTNSWVAYTQADGLIDNAVNSVAVDGNLVWFATNEGVSQYNVKTNKWRAFKRQDGLVSERVSSIAVDGNYVWFGTDRGLNRYDKTIDSWAVRSKKDGLVSNNIKTIAVEPEYVWVGTGADKMSHEDRRFMGRREKKPSMGGVSRYQRSTDSWNNYSKADGLIGEEITTIAVGEDTVWFGTYDAGVSSYSKTDQTFIGTYTKTDLLVSNKIRSIVVDGNNVWFGTANGGAQRYIKSVNTWVKYTREDGLADDHVTCIFVSGNEVWFGSYQSGVSKFDKISGKWTIYTKADQLADDDVRTIAVDDNGQMWIGTAEGLSKYNPENREWSSYNKKDGLVSDYINAIATGSDEIWIGTDRGLGHRQKNGQWKFYDKDDGLTTKTKTAEGRMVASEFVTSILNLGETLWLGTSGGLFQLDKSRDTLKSFANEDGLPNELITTVAGNDRYIWAGTHNGLWRYEPQTKKAILYDTKNGLAHNSINTILVSGNDIWVGTEGGLSKYDSQSDSWISPFTADAVGLRNEDGLHSRNVRALTLDSTKGYLWIGTPTGLVGLDLKTNELKRFENVSDYNIRDMALLGDSLWLCTTTGLIEYRLPEDNLQAYRAQVSMKPLREYSVSNIEFDGDYIWFSNWEESSNGGIVRFNRRAGTWQQFTRADIFEDTKAKSITQIRYIKVDGDYVWFSTDLGVLRYHKVTDTWRHYTTKDGLSSDDLGDINVSKRSVWVGGVSGSEISRFDKQTQRWSVIKLPGGEFFLDRITSIAVDGDDVWFGMRTGVYKFNEQTGEMTTYTTKDGLVSNGTQWISVDDKYVWVTGVGWGRDTNKGLSRYDKASGRWQTFSTTDVLMDDDIRKIVISDKDAWIIYDSWWGVGITRYNYEQDEWTNIKPKGDFGSAITEIAEDGDYIWLATEDNGVKRYHFASGTWTSFDQKSGLLQNHINERSLKVGERYVWIGTPRGLNRYDKQTESWTYFTKMDTLAGREVKALAVDDRYVWCGTDEGVSRYDKWYGTWENFRKKGGMQRRRTSRGSYGWWEPEEEESLADNNVSAITVDDQYVWIGTRNGANRYDKIADRWDKYTPENGLPSPDVTSVAIAGNNVWMGTNAGIGKYPRTADDPNAWISYTSGTEIQAMAVSKEFAQTLISDEVWSISASKKAVWVGTRRGVSRYDPSKDLWVTFTEEDGLASNEVSSIAIDGDNVWFGGDKGVTLYSESTRDWIQFTTQDGLSSNRITCIAVNGEDVWFGTFDAGVTRYSKKNKTWQTFTKENGLAHNGILSIAADGDNVWVGTHRGLSRYNKHTNTWTTYTEHYGPEDI